MFFNNLCSIFILISLFLYICVSENSIHAAFWNEPGNDVNQTKTSTVYAATQTSPSFYNKMKKIWKTEPIETLNVTNYNDTPLSLKDKSQNTSTWQWWSDIFRRKSMNETDTPRNETLTYTQVVIDVTVNDSNERSGSNPSENNFLTPDLSKLNCQPIAEFKVCVESCQDSIPISETDYGASFDISDISALRTCYEACKHKYIDSPIKGCLSNEGGVIDDDSINDIRDPSNPPRMWKGGVVKSIVLRVILFISLAIMCLCFLYFKAYLIVPEFIKQFDESSASVELPLNESVHWSSKAAKVFYSTLMCKWCPIKIPPTTKWFFRDSGHSLLLNRDDLAQNVQSRDIGDSNSDRDGTEMSEYKRVPLSDAS